MNIFNEAQNHASVSGQEAAALLWFSGPAAANTYSCAERASVLSLRMAEPTRLL